MPLAIVGIGILFLLILMTVFKLNAFISLLVTSFLVAILNQMGINEALSSILRGLGDTLGSIILIITFGAMLGKLIEESGAALVITHQLTELFGQKYIQIAIVFTGFLVGLPMIYNAGFLVLIPLIYTLSKSAKLPLLYLGIPMSASLSIAHAYLPPHPAPVAVSAIYGADVNVALLYGLIPCIPAMIIAGLLLSRFFSKLEVNPPENLYEYKEIPSEKLPSLSMSLLTTLSPVILMLLGAVITFTAGNQAETWWMNSAKFISNPNIALFISVIIGLYTLGVRQGRNISELMKSLEKSAAGIAMIILIIGSGGALKQVLFDSGVAEYIKTITLDMKLNPIVLAWVVAALLRLTIGSSTVATITAAGIMLPIVAVSGVKPELMVLATGSGSIMFSHFNDVGFWMFKEYYNISIKQTFQIWTVMECLIGTIGLITVLIIHHFL